MTSGELALSCVLLILGLYGVAEFFSVGQGTLIAFYIVSFFSGIVGECALEDWITKWLWKNGYRPNIWNGGLLEAALNKFRPR